MDRGIPTRSSVVLTAPRRSISDVGSLKLAPPGLEPYDTSGVHNVAFYCAALFLTLMALFVGSVYLYNSSTWRAQKALEPPPKPVSAGPLWCMYPRGGGSSYTAANVPMTYCSAIVYDWVTVHADLRLRALDDRELVTELPPLRRLRSAHTGLTLHVRLSGRGLSGLGNRVLATLLHSNADVQHQLILEIVSFLELHELDGVLLDLGAAVAAHRISTDQAVRNVRIFVQTCHDFLVQYNKQFSLLVPTDPALTFYYDIDEYLATLPKLFVVYATHQLHSKQHRSCPAPYRFHGTKKPRGVQDVASVVSSLMLRVSDPSQRSRLLFGVSLLGTVYVGDSHTVERAASFSPGIFQKYLPFSKICQLLASDKLWTQHRDPPNGSDCLVAWKGGLWMSTPTAESFAWLGNASMHVHSVAVFSIEADDYLGTCGGGANPLLSRIRRLVDERNMPVVARLRNLELQQHLKRRHSDAL